MLRREHRGKLNDFGFGNNFFNMTPKSQATKEKINRVMSKFKTFVHQRS